MRNDKAIELKKGRDRFLLAHYLLKLYKANLEMTPLALVQELIVRTECMLSISIAYYFTKCIRSA